MPGTRQLSGVYPILATCFKDNNCIDYKSQERLIRFCIDNGVHGLVTLANASEGHLLSDEEKKELMAFVIKKADGRVPVVVTINHPAAYCAVEMARYAESRGADAVMCMPPFFGRWRSGLKEIFSYFQAIDQAVNIPVILQDHQLSDISLPADFIIEMAGSLQHLQYVKLEFGNIIDKARKLLDHPDNTLTAIFGGNSGVFLPEEYEAGCRGTMPACYMPDVFRKTWDLLEAGEDKEAVWFFTPFSRLAAYEKDVANRCLWKILLAKKGVIQSSKTRGPAAAFDQRQIDQLVRVAENMGLNF